MVDGTRLAHIAVREGLFIVLSATGAVLFLNHDVFYLEPRRMISFPVQAYAIVTLAILGFVRALAIVAGMRAPRTGEWQCPECGHWIEDRSHSAQPNPRPSPARRELPGPALARALPVARPPLASLSLLSLSSPIAVVNPPVDSGSIGEPRHHPPFTGSRPSMTSPTKRTEENR